MNPDMQAESDIIPGEQGAPALRLRSLSRAWRSPSRPVSPPTGNGGAVKRVRLEIGGDLIYRRGEGVIGGP